MCKIHSVGICRLGLAAAFAIALGAAANAQSDRQASGAQRYQSFGYNSQLKQCVSPAACGVGKPTHSANKNVGDHPDSDNRSD